MTVSYKKIDLLRVIKEKGFPDTLTDVDIANLIPGSADRRYGLVQRALAAKKLVRVRRGLYVLGDIYRKNGIHSFELAERIYGPSYISFESALSYYGMIPEAVYTITSGCSNRSKEFETPFGNFSYTRIPYGPLYTQVKRVKENNSIFFIANPLRALADYIYYSRREWDLRSLEQSLRLEEVPKIEKEEFMELKKFYTHVRVQSFLNDYARRIY